MQDYQETTEDRLRRQALKRVTNYVHPDIQLEHQPIHARQCEELQAQLRELVRQKVEIARREQEARNFGKEYEKVYEQFVTMTGRNDVQHHRMCKDIRQMHQMADMLLHPPSYDGKLELYSNRAANHQENEEYNQMFNKYEKMHKAGHEFDEYEAEQIIRRAKDYYLRDRS